MSQHSSDVDISLRSPVFPGGSLVSAIFDRDVTRLSDRGGASGLIGDRWSDHCSDAMAEWPGSTVPLDGRDVRIDRVVRFDAVPAIERLASRKKLQNPDYVVVGRDAAGQRVFAADAKFSVETAGASQVSAEALQALMEIGPVVTDALGDLAPSTQVSDGLFLSPDYSLTHYMMRRKRGYRSLSVHPDQVVLLPVTALGFFKPLEGSTLIPIFAETDGYNLETRRSLLLAQYYFRLVRAAVGCWNDEVASLLIPKQRPELDLPAVDARARDLAVTATSAWEIIEQWDAQADRVRQQRDAINDVTLVPLINRELRERVETAARQAGVERPPSVNRVRRRIGSWFRDQLVEQFGPLMPPVDDFPGTLRDLAVAADGLREGLDAVTNRVIAEMVDDVKAATQR